MLWLLVLAGLYLAVVLTIAWVSLHPFRMPLFFAPGIMGAPQEPVEFRNPEGIALRGWWIQPADGAQTVAVFCHGYMMNRSELAPVAFDLWQRGRASLVFDFRAHGRSGGRKCGLGCFEKEDVKAACAFVRQRLPDARIVLVGSSMGSAAAALAMAEEPDLADALVLDSAYATLASAVVGWWRFLGGPVLAFALWPTSLVAWPLAGFSPFHVRVWEALQNVRKPVLVMHGAQDTLALPSEARRNLESLPEGTPAVWFEGCGHSEGRWLQPELYRSALLSFLDSNGL